MQQLSSNGGEGTIPANQFAPWLSTAITLIVVAMWVVILLVGLFTPVDPLIVGGTQAVLMVVVGSIFGKMVATKNGDK